MEAIKAPNYTQLKDINGQLFEMQTKILLSDCIIDELEAKIGIANHEIRLLERYESDLIEQEKDLDESIAHDMDSYAEVLASNLKLQWAEHSADDSVTEDEDQRVVARYLSNLENDSQDLEANHDKNSIVKEMKEAEEEIRRLERVLVKHDASLRKAKAEQMKEAGPAIDKRNSAIIGLVQTWKKRHILHANQAELKKRNVELQDENKKLLLQVQALPSEQSPDSGEGNSRATEPSVPRLAALPNQLEAAQSPEVESSSSQDQSFDSDEMNNGKGNREEINAVKDLVGRRAIVQSGGGGKVNGLPQGGSGEKEPPKKTVELERPKLGPSPKAKRRPSTPPQGTSRDPESKRKASPLARKTVGREQRDPEPENISPPLMRKTNVRDPELKRIAPAVSTVAVSPLARKKTDPAPNRRSSPRSLHKDSPPQHEDVPRRSSREGKLTERMRDALTNNKRAAAAPPSPAKVAAKKTASPEVARNRNDFSPPQKRAKLADRNSKKDSPKLKSTEDAEESSPNKTIEETPTSPSAPPPSEKDQSLMDLDLDQEFDTIGSVSSGDFASPSGGGSFFGGGASVAGGDDDEGDDWF